MSHQPLPSARGATQSYAHEQEGLKQGLKPRQIQMIEMGGSIGTGLFLGAGGRLPGCERPACLAQGLGKAPLKVRGRGTLLTVAVDPVVGFFGGHSFSFFLAGPLPSTHKVIC